MFDRVSLSLIYMYVVQRDSSSRKPNFYIASSTYSRGVIHVAVLLDALSTNKTPLLNLTLERDVAGVFECGCRIAPWI